MGAPPKRPMPTPHRPIGAVLTSRGWRGHRYEALIPRRKLDAFLKRPSFDGEQIVVLLMVLRAEVNVGYEEQVGQLAALNGEPVKSLRGLKEHVEQIASGQLCFRMDSGEMIVMDAAKCWQSEPRIFRDHRITTRASSDLL